jgi:hypothetical protein
MTEWIVVLGVILAVIGLAVYRYRKHLQTAWIMYQTFRKFKQQVKPKQKQVSKKQSSKDAQLVRCPKCNKWIPQDEAVKLKANFYCSLSCMEQSVSFTK